MRTVDAVMDLLEQQHRRKGAAAQICVVRNDQVVLDRVLGCSRDALFYIYSSSKPFVALLVHLLAERGQLGLDDPVAAHWPQFAQHGKGSITIRHVLQHRAGIPVPGGLFATMAHMHDWNKSVRDAECAEPRWPAGQVPAYHFLSYGFILGELVQRVTGRPIQQVLADELLEPLGLNDIHLGLPDDLLSRAVPVIAGQSSEIINQWQFNRRRVRQAVIPAAGISSNATQLARFLSYARPRWRIGRCSRHAIGYDHGGAKTVKRRCHRCLHQTASAMGSRVSTRWSQPRPSRFGQGHGRDWQLGFVWSCGQCIVRYMGRPNPEFSFWFTYRISSLESIKGFST